MSSSNENAVEKPKHFIQHIIEADLASGKHARIHTRFPPEPNGYLHIGHAKAICINFGLAEQYGGLCNLRFDDTNPEKEEAHYEQAIEADVRWLGFDWGERLYHASDYFDQLYRFAIELIEKGLAYVCELGPEEMRAQRGTLTEPGQNSPYRDRSVAENLRLFEAMKNGEFEEGKAVLRAKIDMASPNLNLRDPVIYRVRFAEHHATGDRWCIYPMYDYTHCISDALEGITHSLCTLEFEDHRPLYDWFLDQVSVPCHPQQIEFARLELDYIITSKRKLNQLVQEGLVNGWDDPRMPTLSGMRRRGIPPEAIRDLIDRVGVTKKKATIELGLLETCVRDWLGPRAPRYMAVLDPIKVVITNYPEGEEEQLDAPLHSQNPEMGTRKLPFGREIYIERDDFMEDPPKKYFRLKPGGAVRLRYAYIIDFEQVVRDESGRIVEIHCTYDPDTRSGIGTSERKVKGTIHWVPARASQPARVRLIDRLFTVPDPDRRDEPFTAFINPEAMREMPEARLEPALSAIEPGQPVQFERLGYFTPDSHDHQPGAPVFNRIMTLRDTWAKKKS